MFPVGVANKSVGAAKALKDKGAKKIYGAVTHPLLSGPAFDRLNRGDTDKLFVTATINFDEHACDRIVKISAAPLFGEAIKRTFKNESISSLFNIDKG